MVPRISVDFLHTIRDSRSRIYIPAHVHPELLGKNASGTRVIFVQDHDFEIDATLEFDSSVCAWFAQPDWSTLRWLRIPNDVLAGLKRKPSFPGSWATAR